MPGLDLFVNVANVMFLCSYSVRDILWLRILTIAGTSLLMPFYYFQSSTLWLPIGWNLIFIAINLIWITLLLLERRPVPFTKEERRLYERALKTMSERDAFKLLRLGDTQTVSASARLLTQGEPVQLLSLIIEGEVQVEVDGVVLDTLGEGRFLGGTAFLAHNEPFVAPISAVATTQCRVLVWKIADLQSQFERGDDGHLESGIEAIIGLEISRFLKTARAHALHAAL